MNKTWFWGLRLNITNLRYGSRTDTDKTTCCMNVCNTPPRLSEDDDFLLPTLRVNGNLLRAKLEFE
jgi:hypothetical protein